MNTCFHLTSLLLFVAAFLSDHQVNCKCGSLGIADTPWAACLVAENEECPNNFIKLEDDTTCSPSSRRTPAWKPRVCCLLTPNMEFKIKDSPCLAGSPASNDEAKKTRKHHWFRQKSTLTSICFIANKNSFFGNCRTTSLITKKWWLQYAKVTVTIISEYRSLFPRDIANLLVQFVLNGLVSE